MACCLFSTTQLPKPMLAGQFDTKEPVSENSEALFLSRKYIQNVVHIISDYLFKGQCFKSPEHNQLRINTAAAPK